METKTRSLVKAICYRIFALFITIIIAYLWTGKLVLSTGIGITYTVIAFIGYFTYERIWAHISWGRARPKISVRDRHKPRYLGLKIRSFIDLMRPLTMLGAFMAGFFVVLMYSAFYSIPFNFPLAILCGLIMGFLQAGGQAMNQSLMEEVHIDVINNKLYRPIVKGVISLKEGKAFSILLFLTGISLGFLLSPLFGLFTIIITFFAIFYTMPPIRAKRIFLANNIWQGIARGLLPVVSIWYGLSGRIDIFPVVLGIVIATWISGAQGTKDINDVKGDRHFGIKTLFVVLGRKKAVRMIFLTMAISFILLIKFVSLRLLPPQMLALLILIAPSFYIIHSLRNLKTLRLLENSTAWGLFYGTLGMWYILPAILLLF